MITNITIYNSLNQVNNISVEKNRNENAIMFGLIILVALALFLAAMS